MPSRFARLLPLLAVALFPVSAADGSPIVRESGAIYLSDFDAKPLKVLVREPAPATFDLGGTRYVGTLRVGQHVEIQAITEDAYRVRGNAQQGQILGWVSPKFLEPLAPELLESLRKSDERRKVVADLIAKNEVAIGMTPEEVQLAVGKPQKRSTRSTQGKAPEETWEFVKYATIPQYTNIVGPDGAVSVATTYIKTPVGRLTVSFKDGIVESLDQSEGTLLNAAGTTIVAPPIVFAW